MADLSAASNQINLAAVKRVDPFARDLLEKASQVALYTFNGDTNEWKKTDVEGALFVYSRTGEPYQNIVILNRLNTNNLVEPVVPGLDIQRQEPFLLYRNTQCKIFGIWFYDKEECVTIANVLNRLVKEASGMKAPQHPHPQPQPLQQPPPSQPPPQPVIKAAAMTLNINNNNNNVNDNSVDIFSLLSKAQQDYNSVKVTTPPHVTPGSTTETPQTVLEFFAKASSSSKKPTVSQPPGMFIGQHPGQRMPAPEGNDANLKPILQRLMSNPVHSVEHIEKQQRSVTPQQVEAPPPEKRSSQKEQKRCGFKLKPMKENGKQNVVQAQPGNNLNNPTTNPATVVTNGLNFLRISPTNTGASSGVMQSPRTPGGPAPLLDSRPDVTPKPALMPPVMFTSSPSVEATPQPIPQAAQPAAMFQCFPDLSELATRQTSGTHSSPLKPEPLTKNQLLQAFHYLLKNDPDFVNTLHEAYVKSFAEIVP